MAGLIFAAFVLNSFADSVTLKPTADAMLDEKLPTSNSGGNPDLVSGTLGPSAGSARRRIVLKFDLAGQIPPGATVASATMTINVVLKIPLGAANSNFLLRQITQSWKETEVTWISRQVGASWISAGGDFSGPTRASTPVTGLGSYQFDSTAGLVADVQNWLNDSNSNNGWILMSDSELVPKTARHFAPREDVANSPSLTVIYTPPSPPLVMANTSPLAGGIYAMPYSQTLLATGGTPGYTWSVVAGSVPGGLNLAPSSGVLGGTPAAAGTFNFTTRVTDSAGVNTDKPFSLTIGPLVPAMITNVVQNGAQLIFLFNAIAGQSYGIEFRDRFASTNLWSTLTNLGIRPGSGMLSITNTLSGAQRFYRVRTP